MRPWILVVMLCIAALPGTVGAEEKGPDALAFWEGAYVLELSATDKENVKDVTEKENTYHLRLELASDEVDAGKSSTTVKFVIKSMVLHLEQKKAIKLFMDSKTFDVNTPGVTAAEAVAFKLVEKGEAVLTIKFNQFAQVQGVAGLGKLGAAIAGALSKEQKAYQKPLLSLMSDQDAADALNALTQASWLRPSDKALQWEAPFAVKNDYCVTVNRKDLTVQDGEKSKPFKDAAEEYNVLTSSLAKGKDKAAGDPGADTKEEVELRFYYDNDGAKLAGGTLDYKYEEHIKHGPKVFDKWSTIHFQFVRVGPK